MASSPKGTRASVRVDNRPTHVSNARTSGACMRQNVRRNATSPSVSHRAGMARREDEAETLPWWARDVSEGTKRCGRSWHTRKLT